MIRLRRVGFVLAVASVSWAGHAGAEPSTTVPSPLPPELRVTASARDDATNEARALLRDDARAVSRCARHRKQRCDLQQRANNADGASALASDGSSRMSGHAVE